MVVLSFFTLARKSAVTLLRFVSFLCGKTLSKTTQKKFDGLEDLRSVIYHFLAHTVPQFRSIR